MTHDLTAYASGSTEPWTVSVLAALVRLTRPSGLLDVLELGTFEGKTTEVLSAAMEHPEDRLHTVDIERRHSGFTDPRIIFTKSDAITYLRDSCPAESIDFAFVDDDHTLGHVRMEVTLLKERCMAPGGLIVLHDVIGPFGLHEVIEEHSGFIIELPLLHAAGGLGVIQT